MIYLNGKQLDNLHIGEQEIQRVLLGEKLIWENFKAYILGSGTSFDVSFYSDYASLSEENFFIKGVESNPSFSGSISGSTAGPRMGADINLYKSYNPSTGVMSMTYRAVGSSASSSSANVQAVLIPDMAKAIEKGKVILLGTGTSFSLQRVTDKWADLTLDNFLISSVNSATSINRYYEGSFSCSGYGFLTFSYNTTNGVLSCSNNLHFTNNGGGYLSNKSVPVTVYYVPRGVQ